MMCLHRCGTTRHPLLACRAFEAQINHKARCQLKKGRAAGTAGAPLLCGQMGDERWTTSDSSDWEGGSWSSTSGTPPAATGEPAFDGGGGFMIGLPVPTDKRQPTRLPLSLSSTGGDAGGDSRDVGGGYFSDTSSPSSINYSVVGDDDSPSSETGNNHGNGSSGGSSSLRAPEHAALAAVVRVPAARVLQTAWEVPCPQAAGQSTGQHQAKRARPSAAPAPAPTAAKLEPGVKVEEQSGETAVPACGFEVAKRILSALPQSSYRPHPQRPHRLLDSMPQ